MAGVALAEGAALFAEAAGTRLSTDAVLAAGELLPFGDWLLMKPDRPKPLRNLSIWNGKFVHENHVMGSTFILMCHNKSKIAIPFYNGQMGGGGGGGGAAEESISLAKPK